MIWTDELIKEEILKMKEKLKIDGNRMPSSTELRKNKASGLVRAIGQRGGMDSWAKKLNLELKTSGETNRRWNEEKISEAIKSSMKELAITRMPTCSELSSIGRTDLSNAISKSNKKYSGWAKELGLSTKKSETKSGMEFEHLAEIDIVGKYPSFDVKQMSANHPFDLLIEDIIKVDVKVGRKHTHFGTPAYTFRTGKKYGSCDLYLCYGLDKENKLEEVFLIPSSEAVTTTINVSLGGKSKYLKFKDKWELIGELVKANKGVLSFGKE